MNDREKWRERVRDIRAGGVSSIGWLVGFYGISTFVGYFTPNPYPSAEMQPVYSTAPANWALILVEEQ